MDRAKQLAFLGLLATSLLLPALPTPTLAACTDDAAVAAARAQVAIDCPCDATTHGEYVNCAVGVAKQRAHDRLLPPNCKSRVKICAARSTCGKFGFVTCCRTRADGTTSCSTKSDVALCKAPRGGSACVGTASSCCDACTATGCVVQTTTTTTTTTSSTTTSRPATCSYDAGAGRCVGTCPVSGEGCVLSTPGSTECVCSAFVCRQCFLTIGVNICINRLCSATEPCGLPNEYCDIGDCPSVECPCCPVCGDGTCDPQDESPCSCPADCGSGNCGPEGPTCGNLACERFAAPGERHETCPGDCPLGCRSCP
jgi:hypothetical protein